MTNKYGDIVNPYEPKRIINRNKPVVVKIPIVSPYDVSGLSRIKQLIKSNNGIT